MGQPVIWLRLISVLVTFFLSERLGTDVLPVAGRSLSNSTVVSYLL